MSMEQAIADAVIRVVARGGVAAVSMRVVATEAGVSLGLVQRTVGTKDDLLSLAARRVVEQADERLAAAGLDETLPGPTYLRRLVDVLLEMESDGVAWLAFVAHSLTEPRLAAILARSEQEALAALDLLLRTSSERPGADALALLALLDGLGIQMMLGTCTGEQARQVVHTFLDRILDHVDSSWGRPSPR